MLDPLSSPEKIEVRVSSYPETVLIYLVLVGLLEMVVGLIEVGKNSKKRVKGEYRWWGIGGNRRELGKLIRLRQVYLLTL